MVIEFNNDTVIEPNNFYCGDSSAVLKKFAPSSIDLVVCSPPYNDIRDYNGFVFPFEDIVTNLYTAMAQGGAVVWVVGDQVVAGSESGTSFEQALFFKKVGFYLHDTMIYEKNSSAFPARASGNRYSQTFEYMFVFTKGKPKTVHLICDKKNRWEGWAGFGKVTMRGQDGELKQRVQKPTPEFSPRTNVWCYYTGKNYSSKDELAYGHPAIFPYLLAFDMIRTFSNEGDLVVDIFSGSGTTPLMAKVLNRKYIGIDMSNEYCALGEKRLQEEHKYKVEEMVMESTRQYSSRFPNDSKKKEN